MKKIFLIAIVCLFLVETSNIFANSGSPDIDIHASFNCTKASSAIESLICKNKELRYVDNKMAFYFNLALDKASNSQKKALLTEQRYWLKNRVTLCLSDKVKPDDFKAEQCLYNDYKKRNFTLFQKIYQSADISQPIITLHNNLTFADFNVIGKVNKVLLAQLPFIAIDGDGQFPNGLRSGGADDQPVKNCADYWKDGIDAETTYDMSMQSFFIDTCDPLKQLLNFKPAKISYIHRVSIANDKLMSLSFLPIMVDDQERNIDHYRQQGITVSDLIKMGKVQLTIKSPYDIALIYDDTEIDISEIARGDFMRNGIESILVTTATYAIDGNYRSYDVKIISRLGDGQLLQLVEAPQYP